MRFRGGSNAAVRHERSRERRPSGLMRGAETLSGLAVEVFIEEERFPPLGVSLETRVGAVRRASAGRVDQKQTQEPALELDRDLVQVRLPARSGRQLDCQVVAKVVVKVS